MTLEDERIEKLEAALVSAREMICNEFCSGSNHLAHDFIDELVDPKRVSPCSPKYLHVWKKRGDIYVCEACGAVQ